MVSYEDLIYHFTDIYLKSAMECSICKENYTMADDTVFLDDYMKLFVSLLSAIEKDDTLSIEDIKETLIKKKNIEILNFQSFLKHKVTEQALERVEKNLKINPASVTDENTYTDQIHRLFQFIFDEGSNSVKDNPIELLGYVRKKEEIIQERN